MTAAPDLLSDALRRFAQDPARAGKLLRQALEDDTPAFLRTVTSSSPFDVNDRGFRYALILLRNSDLLIPAIASPKSTRFEHALGLTKCMLSLDPNFVNSLLDAIFVRPELRETTCILRVLELIGEHGDRVANWRLITRLYQDGDPKVKAKCATLLVRFRFDQNSTAARFEEGDSRVRASIVEALSGRVADRNHPVSSRLLETALTDPNNRVAGNACLALYQAGDARALACLTAMLERDAPQFQVTAAWVMGQTRDIRFTELLTHASMSVRPDLRAIAIKALKCLDCIPAPVAGVTSPVAVSPLLDSDHTELWVRTADQHGRFTRDIRSIDFFLFTGTAPLLDYSVETRFGSPNASVAIVYPAGNSALDSAMVASLAARPRTQKWAFSAYGPKIGIRQQALAPAYEVELSRLTASLSAGPAGTTSAGGSCRSVLRLDDASAERHLVVILDGDSAADLVFQNLRAQCKEKRIRWHCVRTHLATGCDQDVIRHVPEIPESSAGVWWTAFAASLQESYLLKSSVLKKNGGARGDLVLDLFLRDISKTPARFSTPARLLGPCEGEQ